MQGWIRTNVAITAAELQSTGLSHSPTCTLFVVCHEPTCYPQVVSAYSTQVAGLCLCSIVLVGHTGFEPVSPPWKGGDLRQEVQCPKLWWCRLDSNQQPTAYETVALPLCYHIIVWRSVCESNTLLCSAMELQSIPLPSGPPTNLFDASYIAITSNGCYTSCSKCVLSTLCNLPLCTFRWEFVKQGHLLVCLAPVGLLVPTLENPSFRSRIKFR